MLAHIEELQPEDLVEATDLIDRCMRPNAALSMAEDFPLLVGRHALAKRLIVRGGGKILSHVAGRTAVVQLPNGKLIQCLNIGAVCTDPEAHGQGLAGHLLNSHLKSAAGNGIEMAMLWSEIDGFYERHGFDYAGGEARFIVAKGDLVGAKPVSCRWLKTEDIPHLRRLRAEDPCPIGRTQTEAQVLFNLPRSKTLVATEGDHVIAYVTLGKGLDFEGAICEWAGQIDDVLGLLPPLMTHEGLASVLMLGPCWHDAYVSALRQLGCPFELGSLGMFKILNQQALAEAVDEPRFKVGTSTHKETLERLIGAPDESQPRPILPFYVWGLDSM